MYIYFIIYGTDNTVHLNFTKKFISIRCIFKTMIRFFLVKSVRVFLNFIVEPEVTYL